MSDGILLLFTLTCLGVFSFIGGSVYLIHRYVKKMIEERVK